MKLQHIVTTAAIVGSTLWCKQTDHPLTAQDYDRLDSIHNHNDVLLLAQAQQQSHKKIGNVLEKPQVVPTISSHNIIQIKDSINNHISTTLILPHWDSAISEGKNQRDTVSSLTNNHQDTQEDNKISNITDKVTLPAEILTTTPSYLETEWKDVINTIIAPPNTIKFDEKFLEWKVYNIFVKRFVIEDKQVSFVFPSLEEQKEIYKIMEDIRSHIKSNNGREVKLFLSKWKLRSYIAEQLWITYKTLILDHHISYKGGAQQFEKDVETIIDIYK